MHENDLVQDFIYQGAAIDALWTMFLSVHLALIAGIYFSKDRLPMQAKILLIIGYLLFMFINARAMYGSYKLLDAFRDDIILVRQPEALNVRAFFRGTDYDDRLKTIAATHIFAVIIVFWQILTQGRKRTTNFRSAWRSVGQER